MPRKAVLLTVVFAGLVAGCGSGGGKAAPEVHRTTAAAQASAPADCPSRAELAQALGMGKDDPKGVISLRELVCRDGWASVPLRQPGLDTAYAVVRRQAGTVRLVADGTAALCEGKEMKDAPAEIRKALGPYC